MDWYHIINIYINWHKDKTFLFNLFITFNLEYT